MPGDAVERAPRRARPGRPPRATAADVAALAGTSIATVSLVANGKTTGRVSDDTTARVTAAIDSLGYVVDHAASALAKGSADIVILVAPDLSNPYYGDVVAGIAETLGDRYQLLLSVSSTGEQPSTAALRRFMAVRPAGLLVDAPSAELVDALPAGTVTVFLDAPGDRSAGLPTVNYDLGSAVDELVEHLAGEGHRTVAYLDSSTGTDTFTLRRTLFEAAAARRGVAVVGPASSLVEVSAAARAVATEWPEWQTAGVTSVVCATDTQAYGALAFARESDLRVPQDLAVAGFDNLPSSAVTAPGLTSVALPGAALGRTAASTLLGLLDRVDGPAPASSGVGVAGSTATTVDLAARLVIRGSTQRAR
ncbi:hypothetical protein AX769_04365 [Frondihabitans sp. PAMC 28766]|uniref:LacI family DNA-binding transcriptional regulator n=1 Tax=Frondihabitans sp. PAMC 28766 TaxID=1795630 RepID=UPI00078B1807|nr:LacI family DNA-binding transcriptional regulator [Frondihabitans sp. PAMC 28766]AMM19512.1 hypothetical protein AX769_04365 [Frondihabitans sp. PAMC 28766]